MKHMVTLAIILIVAVLALASFVTADVPQLINYQGRLTDSDGIPVEDGDYQLVFTIYDGSEIIVWQETHATVTVGNGLFNALLGAGDHTAYGPLTGDIFEDSTRWLGITVGEYGVDPEFSPQTKLISVPYAYYSLQADSAEYATTVPDSSITNTKIVDEPGIVRVIDSITQIDETEITNAACASITVPGSGYIVARADATGNIAGSTIGNIVFGIDTSATTFDWSDWHTVFGAQDESIGVVKARWGSLSAERVFFVESTGTYTYYVNAKRTWTGGDASLRWLKFTLTYYSTSYGDVSTEW